MSNVALLIAGGSGNRMHQDIPKQFITVNERPVIVYTLEAFENHPEIDCIAVVCIEGWDQVLWAYAKQFNISKLKYVVPGGKNGQDSIRNGVFELEKHFEPTDLVLIHDAIRPMVSAEIISDNIRVAKQHGNAITVIPCAEAMMQTEDGLVSVGSYPRDRLKRTQTPQAFRIGDICDLHRRAPESLIPLHPALLRSRWASRFISLPALRRISSLQQLKISISLRLCSLQSVLTGLSEEEYVIR